MSTEDIPAAERSWLPDMDFPSLKENLSRLGMPRYAAAQVFHWLYRRREPDIMSWTDLRMEHRRLLADRYSTRLPPVVRESRDDGGTRKVLLELADGEAVEAVWIPREGHVTLCLSVQVGCALGCRFCATGGMGFRRHLSSGEILAQVLVLLQSLPDPRDPFNIVFMGMGEPLLNPRATSAALEVLTGDSGFQVPPRRITLSTVGILEPLAELEARFPRIRISLSLHAADDATRRRLMPAAAARHSISELLAYFSRPRRHPVTIEYVLIRNENASPAHARRLARRVAPLPVKVNLIPFNPVPGSSWRPPSPGEEEAFLEILAGAGVPVTVRRSRGRGIQSACGQLAGRPDGGE